MPELEDLRLQLVAVDEQAALVVGREVERADHPLAAALAVPALGCLEQRIGDLLVVDRLEEPEQAPLVVLDLVQAMVDVRRDPPDDLPVALRKKVLGLSVLEERILLTIEVLLAL